MPPSGPSGSWRPSSSASVVHSLRRFHSQLRSPCRYSSTLGATPPGHLPPLKPYTPPPILSPMRQGSGLFNRILAHKGKHFCINTRKCLLLHILERVKIAGNCGLFHEQKILCFCQKNSKFFLNLPNCHFTALSPLPFFIPKSRTCVKIFTPIWRALAKADSKKSSLALFPSICPSTSATSPFLSPICWAATLQNFRKRVLFACIPPASRW